MFLFFLLNYTLLVTFKVLKMDTYNRRNKLSTNKDLHERIIIECQLNTSTLGSRVIVEQFVLDFVSKKMCTTNKNHQKILEKNQNLNAKTS